MFLRRSNASNNLRRFLREASSSSGEDCPICFEPLRDGRINTVCTFLCLVVLTSVIPVMLPTIFQNAHSVDQNSFLLEINNVVVLKHMQKLAKTGKAMVSV